MVCPAGAMSDQPSHTVHAQQALEFSEVFAYRFQGKQVGEPQRSLRLNEPDGPSTAGGKQARQSMVLVNDSGDTVVMGWVDMPSKVAELRSFSYVASQFQARKGHVIDVRQENYDALLGEVESFLRMHKIDIRRADQLPPAQASVASVPERASGRSGGPNFGMMLAVGGGILLGVLLGYVVFSG